MSEERHCPLEKTCSLDVFGREGAIECIGDYETCMFLKLKQVEKVPKMPEGKFLRIKYEVMST